MDTLGHAGPAPHQLQDAGEGRVDHGDRQDHRGEPPGHLPGAPGRCAAGSQEGAEVHRHPGRAHHNGGGLVDVVPQGRVLGQLGLAGAQGERAVHGGGGVHQGGGGGHHQPAPPQPPAPPGPPPPAPGQDVPARSRGAAGVRGRVVRAPGTVPQCRGGAGQRAQDRQAGQEAQEGEGDVPGAGRRRRGAPCGGQLGDVGVADGQARGPHGGQQPQRVGQGGQGEQDRGGAQAPGGAWCSLAVLGLPTARRTGGPVPAGPGGTGPPPGAHATTRAAGTWESRVGPPTPRTGVPGVPGSGTLRDGHARHPGRPTWCWSGPPGPWGRGRGASGWRCPARRPGPAPRRR